MKISYRFVTGEVVEVEVGDDVGKVVLEFRKNEGSNNRYQRLVEERLRTDRTNPYCKNNCVGDEKTELEERVNKAFDSLTEIQQIRLEKVADGCSEREIAKQEGRNSKTIGESIDSARKKFKRNF